MFGAEAAFFAEPVSDIAGPIVSAIVYIVSMKGILAKPGKTDLIKKHRLCRFLSLIHGIHRTCALLFLHAADFIADQSGRKISHHSLRSQ